MKQIQLKLTDKEAVIVNDPVYIETDEDVEFVVTNPSGKLYFSTGDENNEIENDRFVMSYNQLKSLKRLNIVVKTDDSLYPKIYPVVGLKLHDVTVIGRTVDERYPEVIQDIYKEINTLKRAILELYDLYDEQQKEGVIE
jgi:hypothetical protein